MLVALANSSEQRIGVADQPAEQVRGDGQAEFQRQQAQQWIEQPAGQRLAQWREAGTVLAQVQGAVDDQLAHVQHRHRQQRRISRRPRLARVSAGLVFQTMRRNGGRLRIALKRWRRLGLFAAAAPAVG